MKSFKKYLFGNIVVMQVLKRADLNYTYQFELRFGLYERRFRTYGMSQFFGFSIIRKPKSASPDCSQGKYDVIQMKERDDAPIYFCGGKIFTRWFLDCSQINKFKIKPAIFVWRWSHMYFEVKQATILKLLEFQQHDFGKMILNYKVNYR